MFKAGQSGNPKGKVKGTPNKATSAFRDALTSLLEDCAPDIKGWLQDVAAEDKSKALDHIAKLAEFCHPKLARTESTVTVNTHEAALDELK